MKPFKISDYKGKYFEVLQTTLLSQVAVMTLGPDEDAGEKGSHDGDQIMYVIEGSAELMVEGGTLTLSKGELLVIPKGTNHSVKNPGKEDLFILTVYSPPVY